MITSLNRLVGMPVICEDRQLGYVEQGLTDPRGRQLKGIVLRRGIGPARWLPASALQLIGSRCVMVRALPRVVPGQKAPEWKRVFLTGGQSVGEVCDLLLSGQSFRVLALEITLGPLYRLTRPSVYATDYRRMDAEGSAVVVPRLLTWTELCGTLGKEEKA